MTLVDTVFGTVRGAVFPALSPESVARMAIARSICPASMYRFANARSSASRSPQRGVVASFGRSPRSETDGESA